MTWDWRDDHTINTVNSQAHAQSARGTRRKTYTPSRGPRAPWENPRGAGGGSYETEVWGNEGQFGQS